jgi:RHS repeat-associated protein
MTEGPSAPRPADWTTAEQTKHKYVYDAWNRLVKVTDNSNATIALYRYDGLGRRIARLLPNGENWDRTDYYHDESWQVLEERFAGGVSDASKDTQTTVDGAAAKVQWLWDVRYIDAPVLRWRDTDSNGSLDETLYYCNDANMNVTALVGTSGTVVERYLYDPYGKVSVYDGSWTAVAWANSKQNEVLFCGYRFDPESGLHHVRYRYYHPTLGRWLSRDSEQYADGTNLYGYCRGTPASVQDAWGLEAASTPPGENAECCCGPVSVRFEPGGNSPQWGVYKDSKDSVTWRVGFKIIPKFNVRGAPGLCKYGQHETGSLKWTAPAPEVREHETKGAYGHEIAPTSLDDPGDGSHEWSDGDHLGALFDPPGSSYAMTVTLVHVTVIFSCTGTDGYSTWKKVSVEGQVTAQHDTSKANWKTTPPVLSQGTLTAKVE